MDRVFIGGGGYAEPQTLLLKYANRHGLISGATGTGKTVTLQILAESFSAAGVPVFLSDVKGDLTGLCEAGSHEHKLHGAFVSRAEKIGFDDYGYDAFPAVFWDLFGEAGHPIRTTITEMGPLLLSRLLQLSEAQEGVLNIVFRVADEDGLLLIDLKDLQALLVHVGQRAKELSLRYGNIAPATVGAIQRRLLVLEGEGGDAFFGEPALNLSDMIATAPDGRGRVNILAANRLMNAPRLYATFLLWLLSELFETLPEVGDPDKPVFVFFFDEAHLLFDGAPKAMVDKVEQVARLIRSKGVGVYFITQNPADVPDDILGQLGNRVQHALRAYTPRDRKALRAAAETFRPNPDFDTEEAITGLGVGEALVSTLMTKGAPSVVQRTLVRPPSSRLGPATPAGLEKSIAASPVAGVYDVAVDRESAYEMLKAAAEAAAREAEAAPEPERAPADDGARGGRSRGRAYRGDDAAPRWRETDEHRHARRYQPATKAKTSRSSRRSDSVSEAVIKQVARTASSQITRSLVRGLLGGLFRGR
ncbi:helicase HerA-like domain-containing protein [Paludibacillus litoralis]|uniref:helicase HerA-like domain-containing protein n=1 Tax=Paludibacillus litoralis TaxID=3133267 RepID=UPI0039B7250E